MARTEKENEERFVVERFCEALDVSAEWIGDQGGTRADAGVRLDGRLVALELARYHPSSPTEHEWWWGSGGEPGLRQCIADELARHNEAENCLVSIDFRVCHHAPSTGAGRRDPRSTHELPSREDRQEFCERLAQLVVDHRPLSPDESVTVQLVDAEQAQSYARGGDARPRRKLVERGIDDSVLRCVESVRIQRADAVFCYPEANINAGYVGFDRDHFDRVMSKKCKVLERYRGHAKAICSDAAVGLLYYSLQSGVHDAASRFPPLRERMFEAIRMTFEGQAAGLSDAFDFVWFFDQTVMEASGRLDWHAPELVWSRPTDE